MSIRFQFLICCARIHLHSCSVLQGRKECVSECTLLLNNSQFSSVPNSYFWKYSIISKLTGIILLLINTMLEASIYNVSDKIPSTNSGKSYHLHLCIKDRVEEWTNSLSMWNEQIVIFFTSNPTSAVCQENDFLWAWPENRVLKLIHCHGLAKWTQIISLGAQIFIISGKISNLKREKNLKKCVRWFSLAIQLCTRQVFECEAMC